MLLNKAKTILIISLVAFSAWMVLNNQWQEASIDGLKQEMATLALQLSSVESIKDSQSKQIAQLVKERSELSNLLSARTESQHREREKLNSDIQALKAALSRIECFDTRYPESVIKRLHQSY
ncbi:hypothetical protein [Photobacterium nomapromontoriensis]|uniref:hypothetical protein n=1 Tax=Photobacterium nomapromontoriensis TaxID=2910237 RepID=UPI003D12291E